MDSPKMTETEEIKASASTEKEAEEVKEKQEVSKETEEDLDEESEDFEEELIERSGTFYDEAEDSGNASLDVVEESAENENSEAEKQVETVTEPQYANEEYIKSFENRTIDDVLKEEQEKKEAEEVSENHPQEEVKADTRSLKEYFAELKKAREAEKAQQEQNVQQNEEKQEAQTEQQTYQEESLSVVEKPNYDLIQSDKKIVKISQKKKKKDKKVSKMASIALSIALAFTGGICVVNTVLIDQQYSAYVEIGDTYEMNLQKYLKNISNLDATKKSMEVVETYPEEVNDAGDLGEYSNWFDRICNFLFGLFGG